MKLATAKTNVGQLVNNTVKAGRSKLAWADYEAWTDALDKGLKDLPVFFFLAHGLRHTCCMCDTEPEKTNHCYLAEGFYWAHTSLLPDTRKYLCLW